MKKPKSAEAVPALNVKMWLLENIIPYHTNPRTHPEEQTDLLARLIKKYGPDQPIVVDEDGVILKGHGRRIAAHKAERIDFPVVQRFGLSDIEKRAMRIEDNQVALLSGWDHALIHGEITSLQSAGYEISLLGFGAADLVTFTTIPGPPAEERQQSIGNLADRFGIAPFTTLNAREGWWQDRKRAWLSIGIQSELGRGDNLLKFSDTMNEPDPVKRAANKARKGGGRVFGQDMLEGEGPSPRNGLRKSTKQGPARRAAAERAAS